MDNNKHAIDIQDLIQPESALKRDMGLMRAIGVMAGLMIGSGIFYVGVYTLDYLHMSSGWALVAWTLAALYSLGTGLCYAEMGAAMPRAGGTYNFLTAGIGPSVGFAMGWADFWICCTASISALALGFAGYFAPLIGVTGIGIPIMACVVIISLTLINIKGVKEGSGVSTFLLIIKISLILFIIVTGLTFKGGNGDPISFVFNGKNFLGALSMGIIACQWAYDGWSSVCIVAEEIKEPQKNIPRAIAIALGSIGFIYLLFNYVLLRLLPVADIVATDNPTYDAVGLMFGKGAATFLTIGIVLSVLGATNSSILAYPREYYVMARDKRFFPIFGKVSEKTGTPVNSLLITMVYACIICFFSTFEDLVNLTVLASNVFYTLSVVSLFRLRKKYPDIERPYKVLWYPVLPIVIICASIVIMIANFVSDPKSIIGFLIPLSGLPAYYFFQKYYAKKEAEGTAE
jgi:APA family basic amino acid/polyamine antiporter